MMTKAEITILISKVLVVAWVPVSIFLLLQKPSIEYIENPTAINALINENRSLVFEVSKRDSIISSKILHDENIEKIIEHNHDIISTASATVLDSIHAELNPR